MKNNIKTILLILPALLPSAVVQAQDAASAAPAAGGSSFYSDTLAITLVIVSAVVLLGALFALLGVLNAMVKMQQIQVLKEQGLEVYIKETSKPAAGSLWDSLYKRMTRYVPVEKEKDILFDHEYDGIRELDNSLPPWWVWMFYVTIIFAGIYMTYYHFAGIGQSQSEMYESEVKQAEETAKAFLAKQAAKVDETNVTALTDAQQVSLGKTTFQTLCVACHGTAGEGGVGPNLTDEYWIHGGTIKDIFKTIKNGVPEKGMISWQAQLRPEDMQRVASYILTLQGTNPPNAKAPQGNKMQPEGQTPPADTASVGMK